MFKKAINFLNQIRNNPYHSYSAVPMLKKKGAEKTVPSTLSIIKRFYNDLPSFELSFKSVKNIYLHWLKLVFILDYVAKSKIGYFFFVRPSTALPFVPIWLFSIANIPDLNVVFVQTFLKLILVLAFCAAIHVTLFAKLSRTRPILVEYLGDTWFLEYGINKRWIMLANGTLLLLAAGSIQVGADYRATGIDHESIEQLKTISDLLIARGQPPLTGAQALDFVNSRHPTSPFDNVITRELCKTVVSKFKP
jgi:hypothetical protein